MAIKVWDGFDHYNSGADFQARSGFLQYNDDGSTISFVTGRNGLQRAVKVTRSSVQSEVLDAVFSDRNASAFVGFACFIAEGDYSFSFRDSVAGANQVTVWFRTDNFSIELWRGDSTMVGGGGTRLALTANNVWTFQTWNFVEVWPVIDNSVGSLKVWVNGVLLASVTGADTQATANSWWDVMRTYQDHITTTGILIDDLYYGDTTSGPGAHPGNVPLGDCHTVTLFPVGNDSVQFTPLANANWQEVSETSMDSDSSYNYDPTVGHEDRFNAGSMPAGVSLIYGVQVTGAYRKDDAGARSVKQGVKSGATETYGSSHSLADTYNYFTDQWILDPSTAANWIVAGVNAAKIAYNVAA